MTEPKKWTRKKRNVSLEELTGKLPPQNIELEKIVLGTILIDREVIHQVIDKFTPELFYAPLHDEIARAILELYKSGKAIDLMTVFAQLRKSNNIFDVSYLTDLVAPIASTVNFDEHFKIVQEASLKRSLIMVGHQTVRDCYNDTVDVFDTYAKLQGDLIDVFKNIISIKAQRVGQIHNEIIKESERLLVTGQKSGYETGLIALDNVTSGWQKSDLIILAGRPSMGKTAAALSMLIKPAIEEKKPVGIFSLEMSMEQLTSRFQSLLSGINVTKIVYKRLDKYDINQIVEFAEPLNSAPIYIDDTPSLSIFDLRAKARRLVQENAVELIIVDYLQLMTSGGAKTFNREQEVATISKGLKALAKELHIPVIALSQLGRSVESRPDKKPQLSDLRESGQIEQDADMVIFCYRPEYYEIETYEIEGQEYSAHELMMFLIAKHRNGSLGEIPLRFIKAQAKVTNLEKNVSSVVHLDNNSTFVQQHNEGISARGSALDRARNFSESDNRSDDLPF